MTYTSEKNSKTTQSKLAFQKRKSQKRSLQNAINKTLCNEKNSNNTLAIAITLKFAKIRFAIIYFAKELERGK